MLSPRSVLFLFSQMHHDGMGVRSDSLTFYFIYAKRRPSFLLKLILVLSLLSAIDIAKILSNVCTYCNCFADSGSKG